MTTILHKRGTGTPSADDLSVGEIALDTSTGTAYTKLSNGTVVEIGSSYDDSQIVSDIADLQSQIDQLGSGGGGAWEVIDKVYGDDVSMAEIEFEQGVWFALRLTVETSGTGVAHNELCLEIRANGTYPTNSTQVSGNIHYAASNQISELKSLGETKKYGKISYGTADKGSHSVAVITGILDNNLEGYIYNASSISATGTGTSKNGNMAISAGVAAVKGPKDGIKVYPRTGSCNMSVVLEGMRALQ